MSNNTEYGFDLKQLAHDVALYTCMLGAVTVNMIALLAYRNIQKQGTIDLLRGLAVSDLLIPVAMAVNMIRISGCKLPASDNHLMFAGTLSVGSLLLVVVDQLVKVIFPLHHSILMTTTRARLLVVTSWIVSGIFVYGIPEAVSLYHHMTRNKKRAATNNRDCSQILSGKAFTVSIWIWVALTGAIMVAVCAIYVKICVEARRSFQFQTHGSRVTSKQTRKQQKAVTTTILLLLNVVIFLGPLVLTWGMIAYNSTRNQGMQTKRMNMSDSNEWLVKNGSSSKQGKDTLIATSFNAKPGRWRTFSQQVKTTRVEPTDFAVPTQSVVSELTTFMAEETKSPSINSLIDDEASSTDMTTDSSSKDRMNTLTKREEHKPVKVNDESTSNLRFMTGDYDTFDTSTVVAISLRSTIDYVKKSNIRTAMMGDLPSTSTWNEDFDFEITTPGQDDMSKGRMASQTAKYEDAFENNMPSNINPDSNEPFTWQKEIIRILSLLNPIMDPIIICLRMNDIKAQYRQLFVI